MVAHAEIKESTGNSQRICIKVSVSEKFFTRARSSLYRAYQKSPPCRRIPLSELSYNRCMIKLLTLLLEAIVDCLPEDKDPGPRTQSEALKLGTSL